MDNLWQDLRHGIRVLIKNPGFTIVAVISLAIGIGANSAVFSVANSLLLRPLPYKNADRVVILWNSSPGANIQQDWLSAGEYQDIKTQNHVFDHVAIARGFNLNFTGVGEPERIDAIMVSSSLFPLLGVNAAKGRVFLPEEDVPGKAISIILSDGFWQRRFGADPDIVGRSITLNGSNFTVVGVMPRGFNLPKEVLPTVAGVEKADILVSLPLSENALRDRNSEDFNIIALLKNGVTPAKAQADVDTIVANLKKDYPKSYPPNSGFTIRVLPLLEQTVGNIRLALLVLLGSVGFVLLIACANVANLLLARAATRQKEIAIRTAVGASRYRIAVQMLTESVLLSLLGGVAGLMISAWSVAGLKYLAPSNIPRVAEIGIDGKALGFTILISLLTSLLFGLAPAVKASRVDLNDVIKDGSRGSSEGMKLFGGRLQFRSLLVVTEVALSLVLLIGAGLLVRSFLSVEKVNPGFDAENVLTLSLGLTGQKYSDLNQRIAFFNQLCDRVSKMTGVKSAGEAQVLPLSPSVSWGNITIEGYVPSPGEPFINADQRIANPSYFATMGIPFIKGRSFDEHDTRDGSQVVIVDQDLAERYWPNQDPIGKRLKLGSAEAQSPWMTVVGVVGHVRQYTLDAESRPAIYQPYTQQPTSTMYLVVKTESNPTGMLPAVTAEIRKLNPDTPIYDVHTMEQRLSDSLAQRRFSMLLLLLFSALALILATVGIYGVMSYSVTQRTHELGIRVALGAQQKTILGMIVKHGLTLTLIGIGAGLLVAYSLTRVMTGLLYGVSPTDSLTFILISLVLTATGLLACFIPARRATKVDPMIALRYE